MADEDVVIQIKAELGQARQQIQALNGDLKGIKDTGERTASATQRLSTTFTEMRSALSLVNTGIQAAASAYRAVISPTVEYAKTVKDLSGNLGVSASETSRLIQVADDAQISISQLETAMQLAVKNGFAPSIDSIADLADQYNSIQDPVERAAILTEKFGRNWAVLTPLLKQGGAAIREQAGAVADGLIMTEDAIAKTEEYRLAVDSLNDSWSAFTMTIGQKAVPSLTALIDLLNGIGSGTANASSAANVINTMFAGTFLESNASKLTARAIASGQGVADDGFMGKPLSVGGASSGSRYAPTGAQAALMGDPTAVRGTFNAERAQTKLNMSMAEFGTLLAGPVGQETKRYQEQQEQLKEQYQALSKEIEEVNKKPWLPGAKDKVKELIGQQQQLTVAVVQSTEDHEKAQKQMVLNFMQQQMATDGLTQAETDALMDVAQGWGLIDAETAKAWQVAKDYVGDLSSATTQADLLGTEIEEIPGYKKIVIDITATGDTGVLDLLGGSSSSGKGGGSANQGGQEDTAGAVGLNFTVPAGYERDTFPVWARSGEQVTITPPGKPGFNAGGSGSITIYGRTTIVNGQQSPTNRRAALREARV